MNYEDIFSLNQPTGPIQCISHNVRVWSICIVQTAEPTAVVGLQGSRSAVYVYMSHTAFHRHSNSDISPWECCQSRTLTRKSGLQSLHYGLR